VTGETSVPLPRLVTLTSDLLIRQRDALIQGRVDRVARLAEALAEVLAALRAGLDGATPDPEIQARLRMLREQMRVNRLLLENGMAVTDHFAGLLDPTPPQSGVLLSERA
jgi:hypothetical protein